MEGSRAILEATIPHVYLTSGWKREESEEEEKGSEREEKGRENETKIGMGGKGIRIVGMRYKWQGWKLRVRVKVHSTVN